MIDINLLAENYLKKQEKQYNRVMSPMNRFLVKDFASKLSEVPNLDINKIKKIGSKPSKNTTIAFITEDVGHLTGGRYYAWFVATALAELGFEVTVYTNREPVFLGDFKNYKQLEIKIVADKARELEELDIEADIYIGSPISGNICAAKLGEKYNKPSFALIFDPFPLMAKYLGEKTYVGWTPLIKILRETNCHIISLCDTTSECIYDWLNKRPEQVHRIYPCINSRENLIPETLPEREDYIVFISRLVSHKNFDHVLRVVKNLGIKLKVISSVDGIQAEEMVKKFEVRKLVEFHIGCTDKEKFDIILKSKAVVNASKFEGFGMYLTEAIACGTPCVCYDFPTFKEIRDFAGADNVYLADWNDWRSLQEKVELALKEAKFTKTSDVFNFDAMLKRVGEVFTIEPKIGVVMCALNESKFIRSSLHAVARHPNVKKIAVIEGAVNLFAHACTEDGLSKDNTNEEVWIAMSEPDGGDKIIYERYGWALDKSELRNRGLVFMPNDITHILVVDGDEIYSQEDLDNLVTAMKQNPKNGVFLYKLRHFWKTKDLVAVGGQWDSTLFRCFKYADKSLRWGLHQLPTVNSAGEFINVTDGSIVLDNVSIYHLGYLKDEKDVLDKLEFYKKRDTNLNVDKTIYTDWKMGKETQPTHGGGTAIEFHGKYPLEMQKLIDEGVIT